MNQFKRGFRWALQWLFVLTWIYGMLSVNAPTEAHKELDDIIDKSSKVAVSQQEHGESPDAAGAALVPLWSEDAMRSLATSVRYGLRPSFSVNWAITCLRVNWRAE
jgi:hypothetical protein